MNTNAPAQVLSFAEAAQKIGDILRIEQHFATELARSALISECIPRADGWLDLDTAEAAGRDEVNDAVTYLKYRKLLELHPEKANLVRVLPDRAPHVVARLTSRNPV